MTSDVTVAEDVSCRAYVTAAERVWQVWRGHRQWDSSGE